jgi:pimeloyl-ACP methyl ester carboxylesterase
MIRYVTEKFSTINSISQHAALSLLLAFFATRLFIVLITLLSLMFLMHSCMTFRETHENMHKYFKYRKVDGNVRQYRAENLKMEYASAGDSTKPLILFVHGSPGSLSAFLGYLVDSTLLTKGFLITADRPGFGHSNFGIGEPSLETQARILKTIIDIHKTSKPVVLVGHSLGGPLIAKMAMDYPDLVQGLVIVAGSVDPELEPNETWFRAPLATPFLSWVLPRSFRASNEELYQLKPQLRDMIPDWKKITCPVAVVHGKKDSLVPFGNVDFAKKMLVNAKVYYILKDDTGHFIPWQNHDMVVEGILKVLADLENH